MKRSLAREWLWLVGSAALGVLWSLVDYHSHRAAINAEYPPDYVEAVAVGVLYGIGLYLVCGLVRLTWWAVATVRDPRA